MVESKNAAPNTTHKYTRTHTHEHTNTHTDTHTHTHRTYTASAQEKQLSTNAKIAAREAPIGHRRANTKESVRGREREKNGERKAEDKTRAGETDRPR